MDQAGLISGIGEDRLAEVEAVLEQFFASSIARADEHGAGFVRLWSAIESATSGGKRFRPRLVCAVHDALGGTRPDDAAIVGASFELLHTALIVHDDVIDRDHVRRGVPNISGAYRDAALAAGATPAAAEHAGLSAAVIAGDLALAGARRIIDRTSLGAPERDRIHRLVDEAVFTAAAGELADVEFAIGGLAPDLDDILAMERLKTAVYSFETPLAAGAELADADDDEIAALRRFGREVGIAYQVVDDILGVFGVEQETGKTVLGDLREGKRTVLIAAAAADERWLDAAAGFGDPELDEAGAERIREHLRECGALEVARTLAIAHADRGMDALRDLPTPVRVALAPIAASVLGRVR
jgi:geranylgeranyl diphosphate synthase type II